MTNKPNTREVEILDASSYQPTRAELADDLRLEGTFEDAIKALLRPVAIKKIARKPSNS